MSHTGVKARGAHREEPRRRPEREPDERHALSVSYAARPGGIRDVDSETEKEASEGGFGGRRGGGPSLLRKRSFVRSPVVVSLSRSGVYSDTADVQDWPGKKTSTELVARNAARRALLSAREGRCQIEPSIAYFEIGLV